MTPSRQGTRAKSSSRCLVALLATVSILVLGSCGGGWSSPAAPEPPPEGAVFRVAVADETFHILLQDPERITEADALLAAGSRKLVGGRPWRGDGGFNQPWSWHLIPETVQFGDVCLAIHDGRPSHVEGGLDYWINDVRYYCSWGSHLVARVR